jgi:uroporphyrinogen decarboxylase
MAGPLIDVLLARSPERRPVWLMRQAGRYLPEYKSLRAKAGSFLDLCYSPELAAEVTLQPLRRFDFDAAILFSDILVVPHAMGLSLEFRENEGPVLQTVNSAEDVATLKVPLERNRFEPVYETVRRVKSSLNVGTTLIGFCGSPWTVASYMIEGRSSQRLRALAVATENPAWYGDLIKKLIEVSIQYLVGQIEAGVEVVQIFDSWAGDVPEALYRRVVVEPNAAIIKGVRDRFPGFPVILFARGIGSRHAALAGVTSVNAVSVEQNVSLAALLAELPSSVAVQGNLDPEAMLGPVDSLREATLKVLQQVPMHRHIFNLGHGIMQQTNPDQVTVLLKVIRDFDGTWS